MEMDNYDANSSNAETIPPYSETEAEALAVKLRKKENLRDALPILITWIEDGQCNENNSIQFYNFLKSCLNCMKELQKEQEEVVGAAQDAAENLRNRSCCIQLNKIEDVFKVIEKREIWGNFTQNQVEKIQEMRNDVRKTNVKKEDVQSKNVVPVSENPNDKCKECREEISRLKSELESRKKASEAHEKEMTIISMISAYLYDKSEGVNIAGIYSHLVKFAPSTSATELEEVMIKYPKIFKQSSPIVATEEKKWICIIMNQETMAAITSLTKEEH